LKGGAHQVSVSDTSTMHAFARTGVFASLAMLIAACGGRLREQFDGAETRKKNGIGCRREDRVAR